MGRLDLPDPIRDEDIYPALPAYDGGPAARDAHSRFLARLARIGSRVLHPGSRPTAAQLERHAARFGPGQVAETAAEYGIALGPLPEEKPRYRRRRRR